ALAPRGRAFRARRAARAVGARALRADLARSERRSGCLRGLLLRAVRPRPVQDGGRAVPCRARYLVLRALPHSSDPDRDPVGAACRLGGPGAGRGGAGGFGAPGRCFLALARTARHGADPVMGICKSRLTPPLLAGGWRSCAGQPSGDRVAALISVIRWVQTEAGWAPLMA